MYVLNQGRLRGLQQGPHVPAQVRVRRTLPQRAKAVPVRRRVRPLVRAPLQGVSRAARPGPRPGALDGQALQRPRRLHLRRGLQDRGAGEGGMQLGRDVVGKAALLQAGIGGDNLKVSDDVDFVCTEVHCAAGWTFGDN